MIALALIPAGAVAYHRRTSPQNRRVRVSVSSDEYVKSPPSTEVKPTYILEPKKDGNDSEEGVQPTRLESRLAAAIGSNQLNANKVIEDRVLAATITMADGQECLLGAVIDGHGGPYVADYVQRNLQRYIQHLVTTQGIKSSETQRIARLMPETFLSIDNDICRIVRNRTNFLYSRAAKVGACCLSVVVTPKAVVVANAGDCEGLLGLGKMAFVPLAEPHSANLPSEQKRLREQHKGELDIVRCKRSQTVKRQPKTLGQHLLNSFGILGTEIVPDVCYVKGRLQPTRCFGDFHLKAEEFAFDHESNRPFVHPPYSFPYITAFPDVFVLPLKRFGPRSKFITLCCDGVYDFLSHEEVHRSVRDSRKASKDPQAVAESLVNRVMIEAARGNAMTLPDLKQLPPDRKRRHHDDTSVLHIDLEKLRKVLF